MNILAIESSCDETAVAVVRDGRTVLSDCISSQVDIHKIYGGVVPEIASRKHIEAIYPLADQALRDAGITRREIDAVAVTYAPGLIGAVLVGVNFAKAAALALGVPLIPVHHIRGHIAANYLTYPDLEPPFLCLVVSGGHTMLVDVRDYTEMEILGGTRDDAAGECFDKIARVLGMPYPGGAALDRMSQGADGTRYPMPRAKVDGNPLDLSFSGLKTAAINLIHKAVQKYGADAFINRCTDRETTSSVIGLAGDARCHLLLKEKALDGGRERGGLRSTHPGTRGRPTAGLKKRKRSRGGASLFLDRAGVNMV